MEYSTVRNQYWECRGNAIISSLKEAQGERPRGRFPREEGTGKRVLGRSRALGYTLGPLELFPCTDSDQETSGVTLSLTCRTLNPFGNKGRNMLEI